MRTVIIGSDFVYRANGDLVPIELNTAIGWDRYKPESDADSIDLTQLKQFVITNGFTKIVYIGQLVMINEKLMALTNELSIEHQWVLIAPDAITIPYVEDNESTLIIRSAYDVSAIVDENYCKDKIKFLNLIKNQSYGSQFAYMDDDNVLINHITSIPDNGNNPNFILKARYPRYDRNIYPKLYKVTNQEELNVVLQNVNPEYFLMEFHVNTSKLFHGNLKVYRSLNILFPPDLKSIPIGGYTRLTQCNHNDNSSFNNATFEINENDKVKYLTSDSIIRQPKLLDTDLVELADGTFKSGLDLQIGDLLKTIDIPNMGTDNPANEYINYHIDYVTFMTGTTYSTNIVTNKMRVDKMTDIIEMTFTDGTTWSDTLSSNYLSLKDNEVRFLGLYLFEGVEMNNAVTIGTDIILLDTSVSGDTISSVIKTVANMKKTTEIFSGWLITVDVVHSFLTKSDTETSTYVAIEHNYGGYCPSGGQCYSNALYCGKSEVCCGWFSQCRYNCGSCM